MSWINDPFPPRLSFGIECDPEWEVEVTTTRAGFENRNLDWTDARHNYDASFAIRTATDHQEIRTHFHKARGKFHTFPLLDPLDNSCTVEQGIVVEGDESDVGTYQLFKRYGSGEFAYDRKITRPFDVAVYVFDVLQTEDSDYTLDDETGIITLISPSTDHMAEDITWSGSFYVPCRYDTTKLPVRITNKSHGEFLVSSDSVPIVEVKE